MTKAFLVVLLAVFLGQQCIKAKEDYPGSVVGEKKEQYDQRMAWWQDARFGMFICWGPVSLTGEEIGWSRHRDADFPIRPNGGPIPVAVYDSLYKRFDPVKFNADEWVATAKAAGAQYILFLTKHLDGFCMWDTKTTDYKITNTPFKRDVTKEIADACHKAGLKFGIYFSLGDFYQPDFMRPTHQKFIDYFHEQVRELLTNYGKVDILWFDLFGSAKTWDSYNLFAMVHKLQPDIVINNRGGLQGDFGTPEQLVWGWDYGQKRPWETCMTLGTHWAWKPNDDIKSLPTCLRILVECAGANGNLALNTGPEPSGEIEPRQVARFKEIGDWLKQYGESIYSTRGGPFKPGMWGASTYRGNKIYVHVLNWVGVKPQIELPPISAKIVSSSRLTGGSVEVKQSDKGITISVPKQNSKTVDDIVVLNLDSPAAQIKPLDVPLVSLAYKKPVTSSDGEKDGKNVGFWRGNATRAVSGDFELEWTCVTRKAPWWLEVDLGKPQKVSQATIFESGDHIKKFELQRLVDGQWKAFYEGDAVGDKKVINFDPIEAQKIRLNITEADAPPVITEFLLF